MYVIIHETIQENENTTSQTYLIPCPVWRPQVALEVAVEDLDGMAAEVGWREVPSIAEQGCPTF